MESTERKRVLIAAEWFPPAYRAGGPIRSVANLAALLGDTHEVFVVAGAYDLGQTSPLPDLALNVWIQQPWGQVQYVTRDRWQSGLWHHLLVETLQPDYLYLNSLFARFFALQPLRMARKKCPRTQVVLAPRGMLGAGALAIKPLKKRVFLAASRAAGWFNGVRWHASSEVEAAEIRTVWPDAAVSVALNLPSPPYMGGKTAPADRWVFAVIGRIHPKKNIAFGIEALAQAFQESQSKPVEVQLIGPAEDPAYLEEIKAAGRAARDLTIRVLGAMNHEAVSTALAGAHFVLMPTHHENFGHAIVEGWAHGCPVVLSNNTPWRDLERVGAGWDWPLDKAQWVEGLKRVLALDQAGWKSLSETSCSYFQEEVWTAEMREANLRIFQP